MQALRRHMKMTPGAAYAKRSRRTNAITCVRRIVEVPREIQTGIAVHVEPPLSALISTMIEGSLLILGEGRLQHKELNGLAKETRRAALLLAHSD